MIIREELYNKALNNDFLSLEEGLFLYNKAPLSELIYIADKIRKNKHPENKVSWIIDRNVNITNICVSKCKFCSYYRPPGHKDAYVTTIKQYREKIDELFALGGNQLLLQGGLNPDLNLNYYIKLFKELKRLYPSLKLHALSPPEIVFLAKNENKSVSDVLEKLIEAGLDSLPGGGAEILVDRVRNIVSKTKCSASEWLDTMRYAHKLNIITSATMMFGHIETIEERLEHLIKIRQLQNELSINSYGFINFILWPFQAKNTVFYKKYNIKNSVSSVEYIRMLALSRIILTNIENIQASWLTVGKETAQICLHAGANDLGSIMIEENVVSSAGANYKMNADQMIAAIIEAGFIPQLRDQAFNEI
ncbi:MAG: dehypoxanthine futalosine cyclase [Bacteroidales bacterium]|nr:dehypoxanthine futalosine cyclase [Bacteroidales bacterium]